MPVWPIEADRTLVQLHHEAWGVHDGAPTAVNMMAQTDDGFLWFATATGVVRFDGVRFESYGARGASLPRNPAHSILALPSNGLLVGWFWGGASLVRNGDVTHWSEKDGYPPGTTYQFLRDSDGGLWAATSTALARFDGKRWQRVGAEMNFAGLHAYALFLDRDGTVGALTETTLMLLPRGAAAFRETGGTHSSGAPMARARDDKYYFSLGTSIRSFTNLAHYDRPDNPVLLAGLPDSDYRHLLLDRDGGLWFSTNTGIARVPQPGGKDPRVEYHETLGGLEHDYSALLEDRDGSIWVANGQGIERFRSGAIVPPTGLMATRWPAMIPDTSGGLWFAGWKSTLRHVAADGTARTVKSLRGSSAYVEPGGAMWFASGEITGIAPELLRYEGGRFETIALPGELGLGVDLQAIVVDADGGLWISVVRRGVFRREGTTWSRVAGLPDGGRRTAVVMAADASGNVWLGYREGQVAQYARGKVRIYGSADGVDLGVVSAIHEGDGRLWIGGDRGVATFDRDTFRTIATAAPDAVAGITGIVETRGGDLWLHGVGGVARMRAAEVQRALKDPAHRPEVRVFSEQDGLRGNRALVRPLPTLVKGSDERLWIATTRGVFSLDPRRLVGDDVPPTVVINSAVAAGDRFVAPASLELPAGTTSLEFDYTVPNSAAPRRVRFRHRLVGLDDDWREAGPRRQAFYTNLGPGSYRFQVTAASEDGLWSEPGASVAFDIAPAWYQTRLFAVLCVATGLFLLWLLYRLRMAQVAARIRSRLEAQLIERERIARELHDTLLQSTQGLILHIQSAATKMAPGEAPREQLEAALEHANDVVAEGRNRVLDLRIAGGQGDVRTILQEIAAATPFDPRIPVHINVQGKVRTVHPLVLAEIKQIASEALFNIARHAQARSVEVTVTFALRELRIRIHDDGIGIAEELLSAGSKPGHFGLSGMRERAQNIGGTFSIESRPGKGTDVMLTLPATD
ncbi:hypothetical protein DSM104443_02331 [Usitatibacter rugosus]|uniref:Histidine kinase domain-containing protein n=2 Tax=Usitatibacter rugosus TaxID=2732067 RepID=A0A6M4GWL0_9PROT|nr:hypothetical protein DSM104443_02331 [Usitatibacter rugosus]